MISQNSVYCEGLSIINIEQKTMPYMSIQLYTVDSLYDHLKMNCVFQKKYTIFICMLKPITVLFSSRTSKDCNLTGENSLDIAIDISGIR